MLQPKALSFCYFILKVPCLLQFFGWPQMKTILLQVQFPHLFYQVRVKKAVMLVFQLAFVQGSHVLLIPHVQTIVTLCLYMTWCVQFLQIIATCANTGKEWIHQTLHPVVWIYAARRDQIFFIPLTAVRWLKICVHLKSIFIGISSSHLPVTWEIFCYKTNSRMDRWWWMENSFYQIGVHPIFFSRNK